MLQEQGGETDPHHGEEEGLEAWPPLMRALLSSTPVVVLALQETQRLEPPRFLLCALVCVCESVSLNESKGNPTPRPALPYGYE